MRVQVYMVARDASGNAQPMVSVLQGVITPDTQPPTFLFLNFTAPVVDQNTGVFAMDMIVNTSEVAKVYYTIYRCCPAPPAVRIQVETNTGVSMQHRPLCHQTRPHNTLMSSLLPG